MDQWGMRGLVSTLLSVAEGDWKGESRRRRRFRAPATVGALIEPGAFRDNQEGYIHPTFTPKPTLTLSTGTQTFILPACRLHTVSIYCNCKIRRFCIVTTSPEA